MSKRTPTLLLAAALLSGVLTAVSVPAAGALIYTPCASSPAFSCTTVPVPLDRGGRVPGTISLSVERLDPSPTHATPSQDAVLALAGGPGQAALPLGEFIAKALAPALTSRDLLVFDQRGTGTSDPLSCPALNSFSSDPVSLLFERCALEIGAARGSYTSAESVQDIEAIREALGYEKLVLYGTSYGTKVAEQYAARYPQHVEALVLDSVVPPNGSEPFAVPSFQAIGSVLDELCSNHACAGITSNPVADLASLAAQLRKRPLSGSVYDGSGRRHTATLNESGLLGILEAGDLNPALRALLPAAVQSALHGDPDPLLRLHAARRGADPERAEQPPDRRRLVGDRRSSVRDDDLRGGAIPLAALGHTGDALGGSPRRFARPAEHGLLPVRREHRARQTASIPACAGLAGRLGGAPPHRAHCPNVPTLILSGAQDLRTPTSTARQGAALIPDAQLLVVPFTGHSVLGSDFSTCAADGRGGVLQRRSPCSRARRASTCSPPRRSPPRSSPTCTRPRGSAASRA